MAERATAAKPNSEGASAKRALASRVRAPGDRYERDAERLADGVMSGHGDPRPVRALPRALSTVSDSLGGYGRGLDGETRAFMESRFGFDFGRVRVHTDERASSSANAVRALAYTSGSSIVFGANSYNPHSPGGRHLLAHELAHVVQQSNTLGLLHGVQRAPAPATSSVWYQDAVDGVDLDNQRMAEQRKKNEFAWAPFHESKVALLELCQAVDAKKGDDVKKKLDALLKAGLLVPMHVTSRSLLTELSARIYELGLEADAERLRKAFASEDRFGPYNDDIYAAERKVNYLKRLVAGASADAKADTAGAIPSSIHRFVRAFAALHEEYFRIDMEAVEHDRQSRSGGMTMRPGMSHLEYYEAVYGQIVEWQRALSTYEQLAMDTARQDLESAKPTGSGASLLKALRSAMVGELHDALFPKDQSLEGASVAVTHTEMGVGKGTITDEFAKGKDSRKLPVHTYKPDLDYVRELRATLGESYDIRLAQLNVLGRVYGVTELLTPQKDAAEGEKKSQQAQDNAETIRNMAGGRMRLDSDDDWRIFLLAKYGDLTAPVSAVVHGGADESETDSSTPAPTAKKAMAPADALHEIIDLLFAYLKAFTVHARFTNIYDTQAEGPNYINRPFPRALTGQAVQDCGVYALRVAYMLSLVQKELGLKFRFVILPVHVSLVITGDKMPAFIIENDSFNEISADDLADKRKKWEQFTDKTTGKAPGKTDDDQFVGELAATDFIQGPVDMPFKVQDVVPPVADAKAEQRQLWAQYQSVGTFNVFGKSAERKDSPSYLFQLRYLELTEETRQIHNEAVVPFWNVHAPDAWDKFQRSLAGEPDKTKPDAPARTKLTVAELRAPFGIYQAEFDTALKPLLIRYEAFDAKKRRLSEDLRADPGLAKATVRFSVGLRADMFWHWYWNDYKNVVDKYQQDAAKRPDTDEESLDDVGKTLNPPWMPRDEKKMDLLN